MDILVKTPTGQIIRVKVKSSYTTDIIRTLIHEKDDSFKPDEFKLSFGGISMDGSKSVADYGIQHESVVQIVRTYKLTFKYLADMTI